jgi:penicillin G amidase
MRAITTVISALALAGALFVGLRPVGPVPPLGAFLDPRSGIWAVARTAELPTAQELTLDGFEHEVSVTYDDRGVPHIFAQTELDAARALGWVHARDRLFQMEMIQRAVGGTLTQLVGARALPLDQSARRLGLAQAAEAKWEAIPEGSVVKQTVQAYMEGVNAYVAGMRPEELPLEYRLLNAKPRTFRPQDTYYLLVRMSQTLSYQEAELRFHALEQLVGRAAAEALLPVDAPIQEPIEPVPGRTQARRTTSTIPAPRLPDAARVAEARGLMEAHDLFAGSLTRTEAVVGSNNWAVAPQRTAAGYALLAGDPHLELTLPSIWYEAHLVVPGKMDVYGVSFPLSPIIPIGFNRDVAWTMTNTGNDVVDYYRETVDDTLSPRKYLLDGEWRDVAVREEMYHLADGTTILRDTSFATHRGPLLRTSIGWLSQRWTAREVSDEGDAFRRGMLTTSVQDFYEAMRGYRTPAQNMLAADRSGTIGIRSTGRYPIRPGDGRGDLIFDGSTSGSDWIGDQPVSWYPAAINPAQGYLASANQQPLDPAVRPGYQGSDWPTPWRAMRINNLLRGNPQMTPELMRQFHTDPVSELTPFVMTALGDAVDAAKAAGTWTEADEAAWAFLTAWDATFTREHGGPVLFDALLSAINKHTWDELVIPGANRRVVTPSTMMLVQLMREPNSVWWDDRSTADVVEDRNAIIVRALREAWSTTRSRHGNDPREWRWGNVRTAQVNHLLRLPGFGRDSIPMQSGPGTLSPSDNSGTHGASWRFVVELAPEIRAWGTYPGGQSGNAVSARYADRLPIWAEGALAELRVPRSAADLPDEQVYARLTFTPAGKGTR